MTRGRLLVIAILALALAAFMALDLGRYLRLEALQASQASFAAEYAQSPWTLRAAYFALYVAVTSLSLPGAVLLSLAGGGVFGFAWGLALVSFASTLGATVSFLSARYVLRDAVRRRFASRMKEIDRGLARDGALYLFGLRLMPVVPYFAINLAMGLTSMRIWTFCWVSQLGMLAGTAVYVNAGTQLAQIRALQDIASPALLAAFGLLGLFPLLARGTLYAVQRRRVYNRWKGVRPKTFDRNLVVIGGGAAGLVSAYIAAALQAKVTLVEAHKMGGDCLNYGCVPSKALIQSARVAHQLRHAIRYGLHSYSDKEYGGYGPVSFKSVMNRVQAVVAAIAPHDSVERYAALGVEVLQGHARITSPWTVEIALADGAKQTLTSRSIVIAAGAQPVVPPLPGLEDVGYITSDTMWERFAQLDEVPRRLLVLGGGPMGCEMAQAFARLGSQVTLVESASRLLLREDAQVAAIAATALRADGVQVLVSHSALRCEVIADTKVLVAEHLGAHIRLAFDHLLCAVGRSARLSGYGLEELGIATERTVTSNGYLQTVYPNIYAAGDVAGPYQFTHTAAHQAWYAAVNALFGDFKRFKVDDRAIPSAIFLDPEIARVGLNEQEATEKGIAYDMSRFDIDELDRQICDQGPAPASQSGIQVLTVPGKDTILGVTIVGPHAADLLAEYVLAMQHGLGMNKILGTVHIYPTLAEANKFVAGAWKRAHQPERLLKWAKKWHDWRRR
jgi:pyruvate/2-oxoglutarate dehydrogenase complex dihydrolipoamide dehydrogenase (E3) component/uncharacterized membrane protein YdjX (TVP38/TMEM64 family)